jgi:hypothetical protein
VVLLRARYGGSDALADFEKNTWREALAAQRARARPILGELRRAAAEERWERVDKLAAALLRECWLAFPDLGVEASLERAALARAPGPALAAQREEFAADAAAAREQFDEVERGLEGP